MPSHPWHDDDAPSRSLHATARSIPRHHAMPTRHTWRPGDTWFRCGSTPWSKADINQRWGSGGHILACDMLICPTDTRSKNMPTRQPPYIQPGSNFRWPFADCSSTFQGQKDQNLKLYLFKVKVNWMWGYKRRSRFNCTKYHQDEKWSQAN